MDDYGDKAMYVERLRDGVWARVDENVEFRDRQGHTFRQLQRVSGLEMLRDVREVDRVAVTLESLRAAAWDEAEPADGYLPFRGRSQWEPQSYVEWRKTSPRRAPDSFHAGAPDGHEVSERQAEAALAGRSEDDAERWLLASADGSPRVYVLVSWSQTHRQANASFHELLDTELAPLGSPREVRLVFTSAK